MLRSRLLVANMGEFNWLMASSNGKFASGPDALSWTIRTSPAWGSGRWLAGVVRAPNGTLVCAVNTPPARFSSTGAGALYRSNDGGANWTQVLTSTKSLLVAYVSGAFYAMEAVGTGYAGAPSLNVWRSVDGLSWSVVSILSDPWTTRDWITAGNGKLVIASAGQNNQCNNPPKVSADNGLTWTNATNAILFGSFTMAHSVTFAGGYFLTSMARSNDGSWSALARSANGHDWASVGGGYSHLTAANTFHYKTSRTGVVNTVQYSTDGGATFGNLAIGMSQPQAAYLNGKYALIDYGALDGAAYTGGYFTSLDGTSFTAQSTPAGLADITYLFAGAGE